MRPSLGSSTWPSTRRTRLSTLPKDELLVMDATARRIHVVHAPAFAGQGYPTRAAVPEQTSLDLGLAQTHLEMSIVPVDFTMLRLNEDALYDVVMLGYAERSPGRRASATAVALTQPLREFVVNDDGPGSDTSQGDGVCATSQGVCTLTAAWQEANASPGADKITFAIPEIPNGVAFFSETVTVDGSSQGRIVLKSLGTTRGNKNSMFKNIAASEGI